MCYDYTCTRPNMCTPLPPPLHMFLSVVTAVAPLQVFDPLLEAAKGKFSKAAQKEKKRANEWAGKSND